MKSAKIFTMIRKLICCSAIILMSVGYAWADPMSTSPDFLISSPGLAPRPATAYGTAQNSVTLHGVTTLTNSPMSSSVSGVGTLIESFADPGNFIVNTYVSSSAPPPSGIGSTDAVGKWFILSGGTPGSSVSVTTDIYFQGLISAPSPLDNTMAYFTTYLSFVSSTSSLTREYPIVMNGYVNPDGSPVYTDYSSVFGIFNGEGTVDDFAKTIPGEYEVNYIIRSNPFVVTVGQPFRLGLMLNTNANNSSTGGYTAYVSFDPGFATSSLFPGVGGLFSDGFALASPDGTNPDGTVKYSYTGLSNGGYSMSAVPEPATMLLLGLGLVGLAGVRRFKK